MAREKWTVISSSFLGFSWHLQLFSLEITYAQCAPKRYFICVPLVQYSFVKVKVVEVVKVNWLEEEMSKKRNLTVEERAPVVTLEKEGYSKRAIARKHKISRSAVLEILKKAKETSTVKDRTRTGRARATTERQDRLLKRLSL